MRTMFCLLLSITAGCVLPKLSEGYGVTPVMSRPRGGCSSLGLFYGRASGKLAPDVLSRFAVNDLRNKAGKRGATHVIVSGPDTQRTRFREAASNTATVMGEGLRCH